MNILHTESSNGWGGQEIRILKEALGLRLRGHEVVLAVVRGGKLADYARKEGFTVYEIDFRRSLALFALKNLLSILRRHRIDVVNTHSSLDAWLGGIAARLSGRMVVRTRHLSTPVRGGLNALLLYRGLADFVVTTSLGDLLLFQACVEMDDEQTREREIEALCEACDEFDLSEGFIITEDYEEKISRKKVAIHCVPFWKWAQHNL